VSPYKPEIGGNMTTKQYITGMQGVYLVAAKLSEKGFIVSPTLRSAAGADLLVTDQKCRQAYSVQVKTNKKTFSFWLVGKKAKEINSKTHIYVFVNIKKDGEEIEYYVVPSKIVSENMESKENWDNFYFSNKEQAKYYRDRWKLFGNPGNESEI
jgi:hypothetical protein